MSKPPKKPAQKANPKAAKTGPEGERIAKVLSRAGVASRREAERMIALGEVSVNGKVIDSPALNVTPADKVTVRGEPLAPPEAARLWLYYKPEGLVTTASDEKGRTTIFDALPPELPRVMSVGRLDLNSEGLLLLTNDGELKRRLELPSTGWLRKYRVRVKGNPVDPDLDPLRKGIEVDGERFQPMEVRLDRHQGANAWLTVGLREGKNREIRRAMMAIGVTVNRLIRISYGPFRLNEMKPGEVEEVRGKVLRDQLGLDPMAEQDERPARTGKAPGKGMRGATDLTATPRPATAGRAPGKKAAFSRGPVEDGPASGPRGERLVPRKAPAGGTVTGQPAAEGGASRGPRTVQRVRTAKPASGPDGGPPRPPKAAPVSKPAAARPTEGRPASPSKGPKSPARRNPEGTPRPPRPPRKPG